jgi:transposase
VLTWPAGTKVFVCSRATDMRCGFDTLAAQVTRFLAQDPLSGHLFVFRSRKGDRVKVLYWDTDGYALWCKRLERGTVKLPTVDPDTTPGPYRLEMTADDLGLILRGIDRSEVRRQSRYRKPASG